MAPYGRNLEAQQEFAVDLIAGANEIRIWFDDLAERDARYFFQLDYLDGPKVAHALPTSISGDVAAAMEAALDDMRFEKPAYSAGEVALVTRAPLPVDVDVTIRVEGDFMSIDEPRVFSLQLPAGSSRLPVAETDALPADFRHSRPRHIHRRVDCNGAGEPICLSFFRHGRIHQHRQGDVAGNRPAVMGP